ATRPSSSRNRSTPSPPISARSRSSQVVALGPPAGRARSDKSCACEFLPFASWLLHRRWQRPGRPTVRRRAPPSAAAPRLRAPATISAGPWVLAQGSATFPSPNLGINSFQPYYQAYTTGSDTVIQGYFDYRPKGLGEAIVAARSTDAGRSWSFQSQVLTYLPA